MFDGLCIRFDMYLDVDLDDVQRYVVEAVFSYGGRMYRCLSWIPNGSLERMLIVSILLSCQSERST